MVRMHLNMIIAVDWDVNLQTKQIIFFHTLCIREMKVLEDCAFLKACLSLGDWPTQ